MEQDFLDEMIEESTKRNPEFPLLMEEARQTRALLNQLAAVRTSSTRLATDRGRDLSTLPDANNDEPG